MSSPLLPPTAIPKPMADDDDDVSWALQTAGVQWGRGAYQDALVWLRRAAESAIELNAWSRGADLNAAAAKLEKMVARALSGPSSIPVGAPSVPPGPSARPKPSFPVPQTATSTTPAPAPPGRRVTTGYSAFPPSVPPDSFGPPRNSVVIDDIQEAELELSDEEIRELEAETGGSDIPDGLRPLPSFALEPSRPIQGRPSRPLPERPSSPVQEHPSHSTHARPSSGGGLPAFPLETSTRPPTASTRPVPLRAAGLAELPSFPLETGASSLPPVSQWPTRGRTGTSRLPPSPGLPNLEAVPPSRSFVDDDDDGTPGLDDVIAPQTDSQLPPLAAELGVESLPPISSAEYVGEDEIEEIEVGDVDDDLDDLDGEATLAPPPPLPPPPSPEPKRLPSSLPRLPIRAGAASSRPRVGVTPLPPATSSSRPASAGSSVEPRQSPRFPLEPRLPERRPISALPSSPSDQTQSAPPADDRSSSRIPLSNMPTARRVEPPSPESFHRASAAPTERSVEIPRSVPPPSARSIEPQDLPTVSSPSVSSFPPNLRSEYPPANVSSPPSAFPGPLPDELPLVEAPSVPAPPIWSEPPPEFDSEPLLPPLAELAEPDANEPLAELPPVVSSTPSFAPEESVAELMGVRLSEVRGFSDLPASALNRLVERANIERLNSGEEASLFSVALVLEGWVSLMPAIADAACATAVVGEVVFTEGTLDIGMMLRVVAGQDQVVVATWDSAAIAEATVECPWIADDLKLLADGFQALAGACLGPLGDRLDDSLRSIVTSRCEIRTLLPGEQLCAANKPVPGMHIIGGGEVELVDENGRVTKTHGTGEFLFATQVLAGGGVPFAARAGSHGALVLFAPRMAAHELLVSVPPLLEILAE